MKMAVTVSNDELQSILQVEGCLGIRLTRTTQNDSPTYLLSSAALSGDRVLETQQKRSLIAANPYPPSCEKRTGKSHLSALSS
ncbi:MAG: hypothetical protein ACI9CP_001260 [Cryomorphaceae bacterium]|jgi:hypothetical protein